MSNRHGPFASSRRADALVDAARAAVADLVGGDPAGVVLGQSMTANTYVLAGALAKTWRAGRRGRAVPAGPRRRRPPVGAGGRPRRRRRALGRGRRRDTAELPVEQYDELLTDRTRLVAVTAASNATGTRPDVRAIADRAHAVGALVHVDGVHATPHLPTDVAGSGRRPLRDLAPTSGTARTSAAPSATRRCWRRCARTSCCRAATPCPDRFEHGTPSFASLAGVTAAVDWIASHGEGSTRRERVLSRDDARSRRTSRRSSTGCSTGWPPATTSRWSAPPARRTPTVAFTVAGRTPQQVSADLGNQGIAVWAGNYYAVELMTALGLQDRGGAVRAGVVCYTTAAEVDRLLAAL